MAEMAADLGECGKSSLAKGEWAGDVDLSLAYQRVGSVLQTAPGGAALEQVSSVVLAGVMFSMGVKSPQLLSRTREHTLDAWSDALSAGPRQTGEALLAAVPPGSPLANAMVVRAFIESEKMAVALLLALGADNSASLAEIGFRRIPMLALPPAAAGPAAAGPPASFPMEGMGRLVDLGSGGRLTLERAAQLLSKLHIARPLDDGDRLGWTVAMARASQSVTATAAGWLQWSHTTPAFWARAMGDGGLERGGRFTVAMMTVMKQDRDGERVQAAAAAARAAVAPAPAANYVEATMPPTAFMIEAERRLTFDTAGIESNDPAELQVLKDAFADGGARFLRAYHDVDLAGMNDIPYSRLAVGLALSAAARRLDLSPVMMFAAIPAGTPGVGGYDRVELVQECQRQCRLGKERAVAAVAPGAAAPAAAGPAPGVAAPAAVAPAAAATVSAAAAVDRTAQLNVPNGNLSKRLDVVKSDDSDDFIASHDEIDRILRLSRSASVNDTTSARELMANLSPGLQRLMGRTVCVADSVKEPRLRQLVALQAFGKTLCMQMIEDKLKLAGGSSWNIGAEADARNKRLLAYVAGAQAGDLISAGPQCIGPDPEKVTDMFQWLKAPYLASETYKQTAVHHTKTARTHAKTFEMCAGGSSFFEKGTAAIIHKLENRPKTGMRDWGDQQMVDYWGIAWWRWMHLRAAFDKRAKGAVMPSLLDVVRNDLDFLDFVENIFTQGDRATRSVGEPYDQLWLSSTNPGPTVKRRMAEVEMDAGGANDDCGTPDSDAGRQPGGEPKSKKSNRPNQSQRKRAAQQKLAAADAAKGAAAHAAIDAAATAATVAEAQAKRAADKAAADEAARNKVSTDTGWKEAAATLAEVQGCLRLQNDVDQSHGPLKGVCMFCAVFKYGCKFGVGLGSIGKCGYAHFIDGGVADAAAAELKERCGFPAPPRWAHDFIVAGARTGHGGDGQRFGTQRGGRGDRGGGKGGKGGKGGGRGNGGGNRGRN